jgi:deoxyhypusine synthase
MADENTPKKEESIYYWCYINGIKVFSPALTDGALGDIIYF